MILNKTEILNFLTLNSDQKSIIHRYLCKIEQKDLPSLFEQSFLPGKDVFYFSKPNKNYSFLAIGHLIQNEPEVNSLSFNSNQMHSSAILYNMVPPEDLKIPLYIGSQKFAGDRKESIWKDFEQREWFIPKIILLNCDETYYLILNFLPDESDLSFLDRFDYLLNEKDDFERHSSLQSKLEIDNDSAAWISNVNHYLDDIRSKKIEKVVLARRVTRELLQFSYPSALHELQVKYPACFIFAYKKNGSVFFGATPEKLFSLDNGHLETEAVAGSSRRGNNTQEDLELEQKLLSDTKELKEHENVVNFIKANLTELVKNLVISEKSGIKKLNNIQHIQTSISADVKAGINILDIVKSVHPTPAVCGLPQKDAFDLIDKTEKFDRGLYSGVLGWFDDKQNGEFVVGIRSALVAGKTLYAYAGCGIVEGSDPVSEYKETELKLKPILSLLNNEIAS